MSYFNVETTTMPFELALRKCKLIQLDKDLKLGDISGEYILTNTGNPIILKDEEVFDPDNYFKKGMYVNLFPIKYINVIVSDMGKFVIEGFTSYEDKKMFYPLKGFDSEGNGIADFNESKGMEKCRYYYINNQV